MNWVLLIHVCFFVNVGQFVVGLVFYVFSIGFCEFVFNYRRS